MKIVMIITGLGMGGAETQVCNLANSLSDLNHSVTIISLVNIQEVFPNSRVKVLTLDMGKTIPGFIKAYLKCRKIIKELKPDVVHSHMVHANIFARLLRLSTSLPRLICTAHNTNEGGGMRMLAYRLTDSMADITTNVSQEGVEAFIQAGAVKRERIVCMYNGISTEKFAFSSEHRNNLRNYLQIEDDTPLLMAIGRLTFAKDYPNLLHAFSKLNVDFNAHLAVIGDGPLKHELIELSQELGISEKIHWLGIQKNVSEWLSACDTFVLSSEWEGFGLVVAEAMACGRVVVATDAGGVSEVMGPSDFLVPIKDSDGLLKKISAALNLSPEERATISANNRAQVLKHFALPVITQRWLSLYEGKK
ncbi:glycosyl transferase [Escherichia sp. ESNIH1]|uniref:glycosyltransferase n=1 Tax=Escherichia sp. ESNIH1 TaxID=1985876 RepID=UPI000CDD0E0B|nr:glycosyltransferase [Escherichia sp. ESNIH1]POU03329.1 glycosyl transferase [Escherichia sp. ESNIH1]